MNWLVFNGQDDPTYPVDDGITEMNAIFEELSPTPNLAYQVMAEGLTLDQHHDDCRFYKVIM